MMKMTGIVKMSKSCQIKLPLLVLLLAFGLSFLQVIVGENANNTGGTEDIGTEDPETILGFLRKISLDGGTKQRLKKDGTCVKEENSTAIGYMCAFEIDRGATVVQSSGTTKDLLDICIKFDGFKSETDTCSKVFCFDLKHSTTFWVIVIGIPLSIIIAIVAICWLCCHFAYYMCCCFIFHMEVPAMFNKGKKGDSNKVAPAKSTATGANAPESSKPKDTENPKENSKDTEKAKEKPKDAENAKEKPKDVENAKEKPKDTEKEKEKDVGVVADDKKG